MIDLHNLTKNKSRFRLSLIFSYIVFTLCIIVSITVVHVHLSKVQNDLSFEQDVQLDAMQKFNFLHHYLHQNESEIKALAYSPLVLSALKIGDYAFLNNYFLDTAKANPDYMQIRYIKANGWEAVRIDREAQGGHVFLVEPQKLQNKMDRYYFSEISRMSKERVWFSSIDLNEEHGEVEQPIKPVLRVGMAIFNEDKFDGFVIINLFVKDFIAQLFSGQVYDYSLVDMEGFYLINSDTTKQWSRYFQKRTLKEDFPLVSHDILRASEPIYLNEKKIFTVPFYIGEYKYAMLFMPKQSLIALKKSNEQKMVYPILLIVVLGAFIFAYILSRPFDKANQLLVDEAQKLHDATINLEKRVKEEVEKNERKERILQHQSKLSALGELLSAITHQWRHPITRISLQIQNLKLHLSQKNVQDEKSNKLITSSLQQIDFLSETIENFKNFYKPDEHKESFSVCDAFQSTLRITHDILEHHGIKIVLTCQENVSLYGSRVALSQVFLNLINNAKDEMISRKIKNPTITLIARQKKKKLQIFIHDNAGGAESSLVKKIFEPYVSTKDRDGSGIGLYISKVIIEEKFNGYIRARNVKDGLLFIIEV